MAGSANQFSKINNSVGTAYYIMKLGPSVLTAVSLPSVCRVTDKSLVIPYWVLFFVYSVLCIHEKF